MERQAMRVMQKTQVYQNNSPPQTEQQIQGHTINTQWVVFGKNQ